MAALLPSARRLCRQALYAIGPQTIARILDQPGLFLHRGETESKRDLARDHSEGLLGRPMEEGIRAHTPWGEIGYQLVGKAGYEIVRRSDEQGIAPGADTIKELFGSDPVLVVLDELGEFLRRVQNMGGRSQLTGFLKALLTAIESTPQAAVIYTLAVRSDGKAVDAFAEENEFLASAMSELESVSGRKATNLNPTKDNETAKVIRRRLFESIDDSQTTKVINAYRELWAIHRDVLSEEARRSTTSRNSHRLIHFTLTFWIRLKGKPQR